MEIVAMKDYCQLTLEERCEIFALRKQGFSMSEIARRLHRSKSTISRELKRNTSKSGDYKPGVAHKRALSKRHEGHYKLDRHRELKCYVLDRLGRGWSPPAIAGRLCYEGAELRVTAETIYRYIYESPFGQYHELHQLLPRFKPRRSKVKGRKKRGHIPDRVSIHRRPQHINQRLEEGHLEGDLVMFGRHKHNLITMIDRKTRYLTIINNPDGKQSQGVIEKISKALKIHPTSPKTLTLDNGTEFTKHTLLLSKCGILSYFCDPYSSWQKGSVEHANGIIRRWLPKNYNPLNLNDNMVEHVQNTINNIPRKILGYQTPAELTNRCT